MQSQAACERFMDAACHRFGFCLPLKGKKRISALFELPPNDLLRAFLKEEGIEPVHLESYEHYEKLMQLYVEFV